MTTPLTLEEHETRAMLLGLAYDNRDHTYSPMDKQGVPMAVNGLLDADTLEPIEPKGYMDTGGGFEQRKSLTIHGKIGPGITPKVRFEP